MPFISAGTQALLDATAASAHLCHTPSRRTLCDRSVDAAPAQIADSEALAIPGPGYPSHVVVVSGFAAGDPMMLDPGLSLGCLIEVLP